MMDSFSFAVNHVRLFICSFVPPAMYERLKETPTTTTKKQFLISQDLTFSTSPVCAHADAPSVPSERILSPGDAASVWTVAIHHPAAPGCRWEGGAGMDPSAFPGNESYSRGWAWR